MKPSRRDEKAAQLALYLKQVARPAQRHGLDPNDRRYDREAERAMKKLKPEDFDALINGDDDP